MAVLSRYDAAMRVAAALLVLGGGIIHLRLDTDWPNDNVELMWTLNAVASAAVAVALVVWRHWIPVVAGLAVVNGTLVSFGLSRTDSGVPLTSFGGSNFVERGWQPAPEAALSVALEILAAVLLLALLLTRLHTDRLAPKPATGPLTG